MSTPDVWSFEDAITPSSSRCVELVLLHDSRAAKQLWMFCNLLSVESRQG